MIKAFEKVRESGFDAYLLIAGREGNSSKMLQELVNESKLGERIFLLGFRKDIKQLLAASDIFVFPSRFEGMPGALIEALAAGLPVVATNIDSIAEVVNKPENVLLSEVDDVNTLAENMKFLASDSVLRNTMSDANLKLFKKHYSLDEILKRFIAFYDRVEALD